MMKHFDMGTSPSKGPLLGLAGLLVVGLVIGLFVGWIWSRVGQDGLHEEDYLVMVSLLYDRERSVPNAQERLAALEDNDVVKNLSALSESYPKSHPEAQAEARALRQLAAAISKVPVDVNPQSAGIDRSSAGGLGGIWIWLGVVLVVLCVLGVAGPFVLRFFNSQPRRFSLPWSPNQRRGSTLFEARTGKRSGVSADSIRALQRLQRATGTAGEELPAEMPTSRPEATPQPATFSFKHPSSPAVPASTSGLRFTSRYEFGEDPYDEIHPITDKVTGELIAACGFSAELKLSDDFPGRYYAFSVWVHDYGDYLNGKRLKCIGIVSKWAKTKSPIELLEWAESKKAIEVVAANPGMRLLIDTGNIAVDVNIANFRYGADATGPQDSYFSSLNVVFDVKTKSLAEV